MKLRLKYLMGIYDLIKEIKIFLKIDKEPILLYYKYKNHYLDILNSNKDLFKAILDYNNNNNSNKNMNILLKLKYDNKFKDLEVIFTNYCLIDEDENRCTN